MVATCQFLTVPSKLCAAGRPLVTLVAEATVLYIELHFSIQDSRGHRKGIPGGRVTKIHSYSEFVDTKFPPRRTKHVQGSENGRLWVKFRIDETRRCNCTPSTHKHEAGNGGRAIYGAGSSSWFTSRFRFPLATYLVRTCPAPVDPDVH